MANLVTITVRVNNNATGQLAAIGAQAAGEGDTAGKGWSSSFGSAMKDGLTKIASSGGIATGLASLVAMSGPLAAAGLAIGGFTALALPSLDKVKNALTETGKKGQQAWAQLDPAQRNMAESIKGLEKSFDAAAKAAEPLVTNVLNLALKVGNDLIPILSKLAPAGAQVIDNFLKPLDSLLKGPLFSSLIVQLGQLAVLASGMLGQALANLLEQLLELFVSAGPAGLKLLNSLLPALSAVVDGLIPAVTWFANLTAAVVVFLDKRSLLMPMIAAVGALLAILVGGLPGAIAALVGIGAFISTDWQGIWSEFPVPVRSAVDKVVGFLRSAWGTIKSDVNTYWPGISKSISGFMSSTLDVIKSDISTHWPSVSKSFTGFFSNMWDTIKSEVAAHWTGISQVIDGAWEVIKETSKARLDAIVALIKVDWDLLTGIFKVGGDLLSGNWSKAWSDVKTTSDKTWSDIKGGATKVGSDMSGIWGSIEKTSSGIWNKISNDVLKPIEDAYNSIAGPISKSFDAWWATHGAALEQVWHTIWTAISDTAKTVWSNITTIFKDAVSIIEPLFKAFLAILEGTWKNVWDVAAAAVKIGWAAIEAVLKIAWDLIVAAFSLFLDIVTGHWHQALVDIQAFNTQVWNAIKGFLGSTWNTISTLAGQIWNTIKSTVMKVVKDLVAALEAAWNGAFAAIKSTWNDIASFFGGIASRIKSYFTGAVGWLTQTGKDIINGLLGGIKAALSGIASWVSNNIVNPIINAVKGFFGIHSPSTVFAEIGGHLVSGLIKGLVSSGSGLSSLIGKVFGSMPEALLHLMEKGVGGITSLPGKALSALKGLGSGALGVLKGIGGLATSIWDSIFGGGSGSTGNVGGGNVGSGVTRWKSLVDQALKMNGLSTSLDNAVLYQMQTESSGNPNAINLTDINAQQGDPSRGLMQVIGTTFAAYHVAGTSGNIYDPLANIAAAINYAKHVYGPSLMHNGMGIGSGHGYASGGATSSGWAMLGEHGRELVRLPGGASVYPNSSTEQMQSGAGSVNVQLSIDPGGSSAFEQFMVTAMREWVRVKGGGSVQKAFGRGP